MIPKSFLLALVSLFYQTLWAQSSLEKLEVMQPIKTLFEAMKKGDSALLHSTFSKNVTMATIGWDKNGEQFINHESSLDGFLTAISTPHASVFNEIIWDEKILVDKSFAQVWTNYAFYLGNKFTHCGVDAFHLVKDEGGAWKIFHLTDTRRKEGCIIPKKISKQFE